MNFSALHNLTTQFTRLWPYSSETPKSSLSTRFKEETKDIHSRVEKHLFVKLLLKDELTERAYQQYLVDLHLIYSVLEKELEQHCKSPFIAPLYFKGLLRSSGLNQDLNHSPYFKEPCQPSPAAEIYRAHLEYSSRYYPEGLISHAYVRYLGDISGGMILKNHVQKNWPDAIHFYDFKQLLNDELGGMKAFEFKDHYKKLIDELPIETTEYDQLVQEVILGYEFAEKMFDAIPLKQS